MRLPKVQILEKLITLQSELHKVGQEAPSTMELSRLSGCCRQVGDMISEMEMDFWDEEGEV